MSNRGPHFLTPTDRYLDARQRAMGCLANAAKEERSNNRAEADHWRDRAAKCFRAAAAFKTNLTQF